MKAHGSSWLRSRGFPMVVAAVLAGGFGLRRRTVGWLLEVQLTADARRSGEGGRDRSAPGTVAVLAPGLAADRPRS